MEPPQNFVRVRIGNFALQSTLPCGTPLRGVNAGKGKKSPGRHVADPLIPLEHRFSFCFFFGERGGRKK